jgi:multidrug efflux pump subunit AcrB
MFSNFFVDRPIFACVIALMLAFAGAVALRSLPLEEFPSIDPPLIQVKTFYPGANANTIAISVAARLEKEINGVEKMIYMSSQSSSSGEMTLSVYFEIGTNVDIAQVNVQNRVNTALSALPPEVQRNGVTVKKQADGFLAIIAIDSPDGRYNDIFTSNYANLNIVDELMRTEGVSEATIIGAREYSMRLWLKPDLMAQLNITVSDIIAAVAAQNADYALGQIGQPPTPHLLELTVPIVTEGRLKQPEQFEEIVLRAEPDGSSVLLKDVARVELGAQSYNVIGELDNHPTT